MWGGRGRGETQLSEQGSTSKAPPVMPGGRGFVVNSCGYDKWWVGHLSENEQFVYAEVPDKNCSDDRIKKKSVL